MPKSLIPQSAKDLASDLASNTANMVKNPSDQLRKGLKSASDIVTDGGYVGNAKRVKEDAPTKLDNDIRSAEGYKKGGKVKKKPQGW